MSSATSSSQSSPPSRGGVARRRIGPRRHAVAELTVGEYLTAWLQGRRSLRPSTRVAYEIHLRRYLLPHLGHIPLCRLSTADVDGLYGRLLITSDPGLRLSVSTVHRVHATLMGALSHAVRLGLLERNSASYLDLPRVTRPRVQVWSGAQLAAFLDHTRDDRLHPVFLLLAQTGMRRGEAIGLRWVDVDLERREIRVEQQIVAVGANTHVGPPKSVNGRRTIAIPASLAQALTWHGAQQRLARSAAASEWVETGLVFTTLHGAALSPGAVSRRFEQLVAATGVPVIRLHDLRHTSASLGLASGESLLEVSRRLGHSSITITADVYSHIAPATARQSAERLASFIAAIPHSPR